MVRGEKLDRRSTSGTTTDRVDPSRSHAGGENLAATYGMIGLANLSAEQVPAMNPQVIVSGGLDQDARRGSPAVPLPWFSV